MSDIYIKENYLSIEKPFTLSRRYYNGNEVEWYRIAFLYEEDAKELSSRGVPWWDKEPNWTDHEARIERMKAKKRLNDAEEEAAAAREAIAKLDQPT